MAKASIKMECKSCGTIFTMSKGCPNREAATKWEAWARENITECEECRRKKRDAEAIESASADANALGLPDLTGTLKQIAWAMKIRAGFVKDAKEMLRDARTEEEKQIIMAVLSKSESTYWIDNRYRMMHSLVKEV